MTKIKKAAFTLLEFLITMAVVAIIVIVLWFVLDVPQIWYRTLDTRELETAGELATAIERYYVAYNFYPWNQANENYTIPVRNQERYYYFDPISSESNFAWIENLVTGGQLEKTGTVDIFKKRKFYIFKANNSDTVYVCFAPRSLVMRTQAAQACNNTFAKPTAPAGYREFQPCQSDDGTVLIVEETGQQNLLCTTK